MPVTLPSAIPTTDIDAASDDPKLARAVILSTVGNFNTVLGQVNSLGILQPGDGVEILAATPGLKDFLRVKLDGAGSASGLARGAGGLKIAAQGIKPSMLEGIGSDTPGNSLYFGTNAAGARGAFALPAGILVQRLHQQSSTATTFTTSTQIPRDATVPTNTEGNQLFSQAITLANAANKVLISGVAMLASASSRYQTVAVFRGSTCIFATNEYAGGAEEVPVPFFVQDAPGSTGPHTYTLRVGVDLSTDQYVNRSSAVASLYGGVCYSSFAVEEFA